MYQYYVVSTFLLCNYLLILEMPSFDIYSIVQDKTSPKCIEKLNIFKPFIKFHQPKFNNNSTQNSYRSLLHIATVFSLFIWTINTWSLTFSFKIFLSNTLLICLLHSLFCFAVFSFKKMITLQRYQVCRFGYLFMLNWHLSGSFLAYCKLKVPFITCCFL